LAHRIAVATYESDVLAWVLDLPGCLAGGRTLAEAVAILPLVVAEHAAWLRQHSLAAVEDAAWEITEQIDARDAAVSPEFCFEGDRQPLEAAELASGTAVLGAAHADYLATLAGLPGTLLDWRPPDSAVAWFDPWASEPRSIREIATHVLQLEVYYRDSLQDGQARGIFERVGDAGSELRATAERLHALAPGDLGRVFRPVRAGGASPQEWTVRKFLRRAISHQRVHTAEMVQRQTWVLLGAPAVRPEPPPG
jgi:hypothetical protein